MKIGFAFVFFVGCEVLDGGFKLSRSGRDFKYACFAGEIAGNTNRAIAGGKNGCDGMSGCFGNWAGERCLGFRALFFS
jgi:hypothetical protein